MSTTAASSNMPPNYTIIRTVGEGKSGQVKLAVDNATIASARGRFAANNEKEAITLAVAKIVAIKTANTGVNLANERKILGNIRSNANLHNGSHNIVKLLNADPRPYPRWLVLSTMPVCCDLHSIIDHATKEDIALPPALVWLVFERLYQALYFLQEVCNAAVRHGDLNSANVLIGYHNLPAQGLPSCMVVDFGEATEGDKDNIEQFLNVVGLLAQDAEDNNHMEDLVAAWGDDDFCQKNLGDAWKRFREVAQAAITAITAKETQQIAVFVCEVAKSAAGQSETSGGIEKDVQKFLEQ